LSPRIDGRQELPTIDVLKVNAAISRGRELLALASTGRPACTDSRRLVGAVEDLLSTGHEEAIAEILHDGLLRDSAARYDEHVAHTMRAIGAPTFVMGTNDERVRHFCGESPSHTVELSPFCIAEVPVTLELFSLLHPDVADAPERERTRPAVDLTWFDASLFGLWVGCRLPTEAEWEFACGAGSEAEWCCRQEQDLPRYAWYSENSQGWVHPVATREPNVLDLFDMHGNVWEWCKDDYDQDFYRTSSSRDPVNLVPNVQRRMSPSAHKVCRGGSTHALAEMCRARYRLHEPAGFWAGDLGFRLAVAAGGPAGQRPES
jgi:formylglycine-generating enzyme required for sulfatase activity